MGTATTYTFTDVTAPHTISATYYTNYYTITPTTGANGSISPNTPFQVAEGTTQTVTFTPDTGYFIANVTVDGVEQGYLPNYSFGNLTGPHTIDVQFGWSGGRYEQSNENIYYQGTWTTLNKTFHSGLSYAYTSTSGSSATIKFEGTGIDYITNKDRQYGIVTVTLDDGTPTQVDLYSPTLNVFQSKVYSVSGLTYGVHTLVISCTHAKNAKSSNYYVGLDAVDITGSILNAHPVY